MRLVSVIGSRLKKKGLQILTANNICGVLLQDKSLNFIIFTFISEQKIKYMTFQIITACLLKFDEKI